MQQDRNPPPQTALSSRPDAIGVLLGMDLDGVMEVEECFALPGGETGLGREFVHSDLQVRSDGRCGRVGGLVRGEYEASVQGDCKERVNW